MVDEHFYSVRMRAAQHGSEGQREKHISGGELLSAYKDLEKAAQMLLEKGLNHSRGRPDFMQIQLDFVEEPVTYTAPLHTATNEVSSVEEGHTAARKLLLRTGVSERAVDQAYQMVTENSVTRGAVLIDAGTGGRLDQRGDRGVRVSRMDWPAENYGRWAEFHGFPENPRMKEALTLAAKVCRHPAVTAELCWSDDPGYVTGYVAGSRLGYQRITKLKERGDEQGCRVFFVDGRADIKSCIHYLEKDPIIIRWRETE
ncbi:MAG: 6-carboxyhexanoate--CoA ligase [Alkalicoccus sp.]|nr:MAG: 6-carboxyhexanoate--CoA ligase [Alkalicoccus sp.]